MKAPCKKCKVPKERNETNFQKRLRNYDGLDLTCKQCRNEMDRERAVAKTKNSWMNLWIKHTY